MKRNYWFGVAAALAVLLPRPSLALTAPPPPVFQNSGFYTYAYGDGYSYTPIGPGVTSYSAHSIDQINHPAAASATLDIGTNPFPSITAHSSADGGSAAVAGRIYYHFGIVGPDPYDPVNPIYVPTIVSYKGGVNVSNTTSAAATTSFDIGGQNFSESYRVTVGSYNTTTHSVNGFDQPFDDTAFDEHRVYPVIAGLLYNVNIYASAVAGVAPGSADAFIDPYLEIDPNFADAAKYHIVLSSGIGNSVAATPLPASLLLFGTALLGLAALGYRARSKSMTPAALAAA